MRNAPSGSVLGSMRILVARGRRNAQSLASSVQLRRYANERAEDSSASNWGTGEPPIDEKHTERGVPRGEGSGMDHNTSRVGRHEATTSTSEFDSGGSTSSAAPPVSGTGQTKKSRTGGEMSDDGQVQTPHLNKMRTTREMLMDREKETEERLSRTGTKPS